LLVYIIAYTTINKLFAFLYISWCTQGTCIARVTYTTTYSVIWRTTVSPYRLASNCWDCCRRVARRRQLTRPPHATTPLTSYWSTHVCTYPTTPTTSRSTWCRKWATTGWYVWIIQLY